MDYFVLIGNVISGIGVFFLILGHYIISTGNEVKGLKGSILGGLFVAVGAVFLESWPVLALNVFWIMIGLYGLQHRSSASENVKANILSSFNINCLFSLLFLTGLALAISGQYDIAAWFCTTLYLLAFALFGKKYITNFQYMIFTFLGFLLIVEHLIVKQNYSVLFNETIGAAISLKGIWFHVKERRLALRASEGTIPHE